jgi:hypothetical protein
MNKYNIFFELETAMSEVEANTVEEAYEIAMKTLPSVIQDKFKVVSKVHENKMLKVDGNDPFHGINYSYEQENKWDDWYNTFEPGYSVKTHIEQHLGRELIGTKYSEYSHSHRDKNIDWENNNMSWCEHCDLILDESKVYGWSDKRLFNLYKSRGMSDHDAEFMTDQTIGNEFICKDCFDKLEHINPDLPWNDDDKDHYIALLTEEEKQRYFDDEYFKQKELRKEEERKAAIRKANEEKDEMYARMNSLSMYNLFPEKKGS